MTCGYQMPRMFLDHVSTTPLAAEVREAMLPFIGERFGNPSSRNHPGRISRQAVDEARGHIARLIGASPDEIIITASATEANNLAIKGIAHARGASRRALVATATEHISVLHPLRTLSREGFTSRLIPVDRTGLVRLDRLADLLSDDVALISVAHASGEIGTLQPIEAICAAARDRGIPVHVDATVTAGLLPLLDGDAGPDLITLTPHLFYGPPGVGALRVRRGVRLAPLIEGGSQEGGLRAGTESLAAIVGFGAAAALASRERTRRAARIGALARRSARLLFEQIDDMVATGHPEGRVPGLLTFCVRGVEAEALLQSLEHEGIDAASGSACTTEVSKSSHVLEAIGIDPVLARGALSLSFGESNGENDPDTLADLLPKIVRRLRQLSPL